MFHGCVVADDRVSGEDGRAAVGVHAAALECCVALDGQRHIVGTNRAGACHVKTAALVVNRVGAELRRTVQIDHAACNIQTAAAGRRVACKFACGFQGHCAVAYKQTAAVGKGLVIHQVHNAVCCEIAVVHIDTGTTAVGIVTTNHSCFVQNRRTLRLIDTCAVLRSIRFNDAPLAQFDGSAVDKDTAAVACRRVAVDIHCAVTLQHTLADVQTAAVRAGSVRLYIQSAVAGNRTAVDKDTAAVNISSVVVHIQRAAVVESTAVQVDTAAVNSRIGLAACTDIKRCAGCNRNRATRLINAAAVGCRCVADHIDYAGNIDLCAGNIDTAAVAIGCLVVGNRDVVLQIQSAVLVDPNTAASAVGNVTSDGGTVSQGQGHGCATVHANTGSIACGFVVCNDRFIQSHRAARHVDACTVLNLGNTVSLIDMVLNGGVVQCHRTAIHIQTAALSCTVVAEYRLKHGCRTACNKDAATICCAVAIEGGLVQGCRTAASKDAAATGLRRVALYLRAVPQGNIALGGVNTAAVADFRLVTTNCSPAAHGQVTLVHINTAALIVCGVVRNTTAGNCDSRTRIDTTAAIISLVAADGRVGNRNPICHRNIDTAAVTCLARIGSVGFVDLVIADGAIFDGHVLAFAVEVDTAAHTVGGRVARDRAARNIQRNLLGIDTCATVVVGRCIAVRALSVGILALVVDNVAVFQGQVSIGAIIAIRDNATGMTVGCRVAVNRGILNGCIGVLQPNTAALIQSRVVANDIARADNAELCHIRHSNAAAVAARRLVAVHNQRALRLEATTHHADAATNFCRVGRRVLFHIDECTKSEGFAAVGKVAAIDVETATIFAGSVCSNSKGILYSEFTADKIGTAAILGSVACNIRIATNVANANAIIGNRTVILINTAAQNSGISSCDRNSRIAGGLHDRIFAGDIESTTVTRGDIRRHPQATEVDSCRTAI